MKTICYEIHLNEEYQLAINIIKTTFLISSDSETILKCMDIAVHNFPDSLRQLARLDEDYQLLLRKHSKLSIIVNNNKLLL